MRCCRVIMVWCVQSPLELAQMLREHHGSARDGLVGGQERRNDASEERGADE